MKNITVHTTTTLEVTMNRVKSALLVAALALALAFTLSCSSDNDDERGGGGGSSGNGGLKGTSWEAKDIYSGSISSYDYTITITFTSDDMLTIKRVGWFDITETHVNGYNVTYTTKRTNVNETFNGTYTYFPQTKEGYMNSAYWNINPWNFRILSDNRTMAGMLDTQQFTKK
jgi:hypothetical protein